MRLMAITLFFIMVSGCGSQAPSDASALSFQTGEGFSLHGSLPDSDAPSDSLLFEDKAGFQVTAAIDFEYQRSEPTYVNGRPHREHEYWSCVRQVVARFSRPVSYVSLLGNVVGKGTYVTDRPFAVASISADEKTVTLTPAGREGMCAKRFTHTQVVFENSILDVSGKPLTGGRTMTLNYGPGRDEAKGLADEEAEPFFNLLESEDLEQGTDDLISKARDLESETIEKDSNGCERTRGDQCLVNLSPSPSLTIAKINDVYQRIVAWTATEKNSSTYRRDGIQRLQTSDTIIVPRGPNSTERHYALPDVLYTVRKSAKFVEYLFPSLKSIGVADLTTPEGDTPYMSWPDGSRQYLHPFGSHQGQDVDIGYISVGTGNEQKSAIDIEKSFWLLYAALQSAGVDLVYTAHKDEFVDYARKARDRGLINEVAYGRFRSARIIKDQNLGHDTHFHFKVSYRDYEGESLRFRQANDVYNCLLGLGATGSSEQNFCRSL